MTNTHATDIAYFYETRKDGISYFRENVTTKFLFFKNHRKTFNTT